MTGHARTAWLGRILGDVLLVLCAVGVTLAGLSLLTLSREQALDRGTGRGGTAEPTGCQRIGPVSRSGLGYWWSCTVEVRWDDGGRGRYHVAGSVFTPADQGRSVPVRETVRGGRGNIESSTRLVRDDRPPRVGLLVAGLLVFLAGALCGLRPIVDLARAAARLLARTLARSTRN